MLILARRRDECIVIDGCIKVLVVAIEGDRVKLGVQAPRSIPVHREEVAERIEVQEVRNQACRRLVAQHRVDRHLDAPANPFPPGLQAD